MRGGRGGKGVDCQAVVLLVGYMPVGLLRSRRVKCYYGYYNAADASSVIMDNEKRGYNNLMVFCS